MDNQELRKEIVISDQNLENWGLFTTKKDITPRTLSRTDENGNTQTVSVGVVETKEGQKHTLTTSEGKLLYILGELWDKVGRPDNIVVPFNLRQIAEKGKMGWGKKLMKHLKTTIINLKTVPILFENSYRTIKNGETVKMIEPITILSHLKLFERHKRGKDEPYFAFSEFRFHPYIMVSLKNQYFKSLRLDVIIDLRSETAFLLYRWLDLMLSKSTEPFQRVIDEKLAEEIGLMHTRHDKLLTQIRKACGELEGKDISTGKIIYCRVEKTVDGKNWKLVVRKGKQTEQQEQASLKEPANLGYTALVDLFLKAFDHTREPVAKELDQAAELIARLGNKKAEQVVKYGIRKVQSKYTGPPEWFGAILLYEAEALGELKKAEASKKQERERKAQEKAEREASNNKIRVWIEHTPDYAAQDVRVAGSFNNWQPEPMGRRDNKWSIYFDLETGDHLYKLVVDGRWTCDPANPERVPDGPWNENSVLKVHDKT